MQSINKQYTITVPNHSQTSPKGQKRISKVAKGRKEKREIKATREGLFLLQKRGKPLPKLPKGSSNSVEIPGWREKKG